MAENKDLGTVADSSEVVTPKIDYKAEYEKLQAEQSKWKLNFDKASSEISSYKKQLAEKLTADEKIQAELIERENRYKQIEKENATIKAREKLSEVIKDSAVRDEIAELYSSGDYMTAIEKQNAYIKAQEVEHEKQLKALSLKQNPIPRPDNQNGNEITKQEFLRMSLSERTQLYQDNPELYNKLK